MTREEILAMLEQAQALVLLPEVTAEDLKKVRETLEATGSASAVAAFDETMQWRQGAL